MKDWNLVKGVYKDEAIFQLINNFKILVLNIKKIIATLSIVVVSGLIIYGFILVQQILRTTLNLLKVRCMSMFLQMPIIQKSRTSPHIDNLERFDMVANKMSYQNVKSGRFY
jgi:UPF0755 protein